MATFKDRRGDDWLVELDPYVIRQIRKDIEIDIMSAKEGLRILGDDAVALVDCLWIACEDQAEKRGVDEREFARRLGTGEAIQAASAALESAILDLMVPARREAVKEALEKMRELEGEQIEKMRTSIRSGELERLVNASVKQSQGEFAEAVEGSE